MTTRQATTRELAQWVTGSAPADLRPAVGWDALLTVAAEHQLLPAVAGAMRARGWSPTRSRFDRHGTSPAAVLADAYAATRRRQRSLRTHLELSLGALVSRAIPVVPIKAAHWMLAGWLADPPARQTIDIDLVIEPSASGAAVTAMQSLGYGALASGPDQDLATHQLPAMAHPKIDGSVELHVAPMRGRHPVVSGAGLMERSVALTGTPLRLPSVDDAIALLIAHATVHDHSTQLALLPLRAVIDLVSISAAVGPVDWAALRRRFHRSGPAGVLAIEGFLATARALTEADVPEPTRIGQRWFDAAWYGLDHPIALRRWQELWTLRQGMRRARMEDLYGARSRPAVARARVGHLARGVRRRVGTP
ncbi:MAG: nucleotidyltransferase family protein [Desertimonas sp.]